MEIINSIKDYIAPTYTKYSKDIISRMDLNQFKILLSFYTGQKTIDYYNFTMFTIYKNERDIHIEPTTSFETYEDRNTYQVIYYDDKNNSYLTQMYETCDFYKTLIENENRYVFFPFVLSIKDKNVGHATILIVDKEDKSVRFFDSNGLNGFVKSDITDKLFETYINIFNICHDEQYTYIKQTDWVYSNMYNLNSSVLNNKEIDAGHCMIFTLLISHLLIKTNKHINDIILEINKINKNKLFDIIMGYTEIAAVNIGYMI